MKLHYPFLLTIFFISCSSGNITSKSELNGFWITDEQGIESISYTQITYYSFSFKNDSFFLEIGKWNDKLHPFKAKGIYTFTDEYLECRGIVEQGRNKDYTVNYSKKFAYSYTDNILTIQAFDNIYGGTYTLKKQSNIPKTF